MTSESEAITDRLIKTEYSSSCHEDKTAYSIMVLTMVIGCFGFILNIFSFLVWREHRNKIAPHYYLLALAVSDTLATLFDGIIDGLDCITGKKLFVWKKWICLGDLGLDFLTTFATYWVVTLIAVDRCLGLLYPQSYKTRFSKPFTAFVALGTTMCAVYGCGAFLIAGAAWTVDSDESSMADDCGMSSVKGYRQFLLYGSLALGGITPLVIVIASTVIILYEINKQQRTLTISLRAESTNSNGRSSSNSRCASSVVEPVGRARTATSTINSEQLTDFRNLTIAISVVFVLFCGFAQILTAYSHGFSKRNVAHPVADALDELLNVLNSSSNFILYFLSSRLFRKEMIDFLVKTQNRFINTWRRFFKANDAKSTSEENGPEGEQLTHTSDIITSNI